MENLKLKLTKNIKTNFGRVHYINMKMNIIQSEKFVTTMII